MDRILHAGCGPGVHAIYIAERHPEALVYGYDTSEELLEIARAEARKRGLQNIHFYNVDVTRLKGDQYAPFDGIVADRLFMWFRTLEKRIKLLQSLYEALKSRGTLIVNEPISTTLLRRIENRFRGYTFGSEEEMTEFFSGVDWHRLVVDENLDYFLRYAICIK